MSKEKFVQTINEQIDILYQRSDIKKMVSIFIDKYPKDVFVNYRETESFENHLLDCLYLLNWIAMMDEQNIR
ncbi:hypothetical protein P9265_18835 [Schinkia azotoformans]|uniref:hypothetical protein n=1 Tax=Schinkia azotoformans TaxID=1454 RepID=UPI002E1CD762|nr:hypothetical protein [Schinkia azotoformans]